MSTRARIVTIIVAAFVLALGGTLWFPASQAQSSVTLSTLEVKLWPEYDQAGVLVMYSGRFASDVQLPVQLTFAVPASIDKLGGTAGIDEQGTFRYRQPTTVQSGDQLLVSYDCPYPAFQFEYYYNPIAGQGADRQFEYAYVADYPAQSVTLRVQQPAGSSGFAVTPAMQPGESEMGLPTVIRQVGALPAGGTFSAAVSYHKEDLRLSVEQLSLPTPGTSTFENAPRSAANSTATIVIAVAAAVISLGVLGFTFWSKARERGRKRVRPAQAAAGARGKKTARGSAGGGARLAAPAASAAGGSEAGAYCHRCGRGLKADERFCPSCGTPRK